MKDYIIKKMRALQEEIKKLYRGEEDDAMIKLFKELEPMVEGLTE